VTRDPLVVLLAHGSVDPRHEADVGCLARRLTGRLGLDVSAAYLENGSPDLPALARRSRRPLVVVPLLLAQGYHARTDVPALVLRVEPEVPTLTVARPPVMAGSMWARTAVNQLTGPAEGARHLVLATAGSSDPRVLRAWDQAAATWSREWGWRSVSVAHVGGNGRRLVDVLRDRAPATVVPALVARGRFADVVARTVQAAGAHSTSPLGHAAAFADGVARLVGDVTPRRRAA
jgi:sirohydrochlorin ferrochelatase